MRRATTDSIRREAQALATEWVTSRMQPSDSHRPVLICLLGHLGHRRQNPVGVWLAPTSTPAALTIRLPASTREVVLLLAQEGGRLVTPLDASVEDRP
jgi:hypothetical protein